MKKDIFQDAISRLDEAFKHASIDPEGLAILKTPKQILEVAVPVRKDDGSLMVCKGFRVRHHDAKGPTKGGIRFHPQVTREEVIIIRDSIGEQVEFMRDTKHDLREDLVRMEKILDKVENDIDKVEDEATALMDRTKKETRDAITDANNRFNDKIDGMEGYVKRELSSLEEDLDRKLQKSLDNPLANRE